MTIKVKAAPGVQVPQEDNLHRYIGPDEVVTVARSAYYLRQVSAGDLLIVPDDEATTVAKKGKAAEITVDDGGVNSGKS
ncbi:hypothetical protein CS369_21915 [Candidatus Symbiopectobacterium sp. 'North America']|uniref:hypothetical protein n=1 Tax=Candidatus Symbiopectobacterium sp. 'North America' TaxID=2794574 RepID=UPI0018C91CBE|nr:hypothetical protein [Candidatus Symbiopectobacterium sp. 'North America']MBG6246706.1 hypothetical protein [Candidatus Symbiopectobacterium sp. 'North America']